jgi:hypothetical protein
VKSEKLTSILSIVEWGRVQRYIGKGERLFVAGVGGDLWGGTEHFGRFYAIESGEPIEFGIINTIQFEE